LLDDRRDNQKGMSEQIKKKIAEKKKVKQNKTYSTRICSRQFWRFVLTSLFLWDKKEKKIFPLDAF